MGCVAASNVVPFRRAMSPPPMSEREVGLRRRGEQRVLMETVYALGTMVVGAEDRDTKLTASRLQVYGFLAVEELGEDGRGRRLRPSESIRARTDRPWRLSKPVMASPVTIPSLDGFLFESEPLNQPA